MRRIREDMLETYVEGQPKKSGRKCRAYLRSALAIGLVAALLMLASCGNDDDESSEPAGSSAESEATPVAEPETEPDSGDEGTAAEAEEGSKDTLVMAIALTPPGVDWDAYFGDEVALLYNNIYNTALSWKKVPVPGDPDMLTSDFVTLEPQLAEEWEFLNDGQTIRIKLKEGVLSHAGNELTADDFVYTRERSLSLAAVGSFLLNAQGIKRSENVVKVDEYTVEVSSDEGPNPLLAAGNTNIFYNVFDSTEMLAHATDDDPWSIEWVRTNSAGFGPYKLASFEPGQGITLEAHEDYWGGAPEIKTIIMQEVPESANRLALLTNGSVDIADKLSPRELDSLSGNDNARVWSTPSTAMGAIWINTTRPGLSDVRVRQALNYAFPYDDVLESVYFGFATPITAPVPKITPGYADISPYSYDPATASALLEEAGATDLALEILYPIAQSEIEQVALLYQRALEDIGVSVTLTKAPDAAFGARQFTSDFDLLLHRDGGPIQPDINYGLGLYYWSTTETRTCCNFTGYSNPDVDAGIDAGRAIVDAQERIDFHTPIMEQVMEDAPWVWWSNAGYQIATSADVQGVTFDSAQSILFKNLSVSEG